MASYETNGGLSGRFGVGNSRSELSSDEYRVGRPYDFAEQRQIHQIESPSRSRIIFQIFLRLLAPVVLLTGLIGAAYSFGGTSVHDLSMEPWLSVGLLLLPATFLIANLNNRRNGAAYVMAQVVIAIFAIAALAIFSRNQSLPALGAIRAPFRVVFGFGTALVVAQIFAAFLFDRLRGPRWWRAPLISSFVGGIVLSLVGFPAAFEGATNDLAHQMLIYMAVTSIAAALLLVPYWILRPLVPPRAGFGGR